MRRILAVFLVLLLVGGHVACVQLVGWVGMIANRIQTSTVQEAIQGTLDGSAPCAVCRLAADLRSDGTAGSNAPDKPVKPAKKPDAVLADLPLLAAQSGTPVQVRPAPGLRRPGCSTAPEPPPPQG